MHIAIVGCGQLSRMLALAGIPLGMKFSFLAGAGEDLSCVESLGSVVAHDQQSQPADIYAALGQPDVITVEKEQLDIELLTQLETYCTVHPSPAALRTTQDRLLEKQLLDQLGIAKANYSCCKSMREMLANTPPPLLLKSRKDGYDGKHQYRLDNRVDLQALEEQFQRESLAPENFIAEQLIAFDREVSQVSVRNASGDVAHYPLVENRHTHGILSQSIAPAADLSESLVKQAQRHITSIMTEIDYVGVMAMECFVVGDQLLVNELAPRVHNSGHWTQSGSATCQFENHLRAISGATLGSTTNYCVTAMINLIGTGKPEARKLPSHSRLHWYNKAVRPGRKLGHINITGHSTNDVIQQVQSLAYEPVLQES